MNTDDTRNLGLASLVANGGPDGWGDSCPAWIESTARQCGKPRTHGLLCKRHHMVALNQLAVEIGKARAQRERAVTARELDLPVRRAELAKIEARMAVLDPPADTDRAAAAVVSLSKAAGAARIADALTAEATRRQPPPEEEGSDA